MGIRGMSFNNDNGWQRNVRDLVLKPWYKEHEGIMFFEFCDEGLLSKYLQKIGIDTVIEKKNEELIAIEEKIVEWPIDKDTKMDKDEPYSSYALETESCTNPGHESDGWMRTATSNYLFYCFIQKDRKSLMAHLIDFPKLQEWFFENDRYKKEFHPTTTDKENHTRCYLVPIGRVKAEGLEIDSTPIWVEGGTEIPRKPR